MIEKVKQRTARHDGYVLLLDEYDSILDEVAPLTGKAIRQLQPFSSPMSIKTLLHLTSLKVAGRIANKIRTHGIEIEPANLPVKSPFWIPLKGQPLPPHKYVRDAIEKVPSSPPSWWISESTIIQLTYLSIYREIANDEQVSFTKNSDFESYTGAVAIPPVWHLIFGAPFSILTLPRREWLPKLSQHGTLWQKKQTSLNHFCYL